MKPPILILLAAALAAPLLPAQNNPAPPAPPAPPMPPGSAHRQPAEGPVTFLGVETSEVPDVLSEQLNLAAGFGVVVDYVTPDSPAAAAGVQKFDVLQKLNDQKLTGPDQLGTLVRNMADGEQATLTLLRKGTPQTVTVTLRQRAASKESSDWNWSLDYGGAIPHQEEIQKIVRGALDQAGDRMRNARDQVAAIKKRIELQTESDHDGQVKVTRIDGDSAEIVLRDDEGELKLSRVDGKRTLVAKDPAGKEIFNGPIESAEDREKVPAPIKARLDQLRNAELPEGPGPASAPGADGA